MSNNPFRHVKVKCQTCGEPGALSQTKLCDSCWEVEQRLDSYLDTDNGLQKILSIIKGKGLAEACLGPMLVSALKDSLTEDQLDQEIADSTSDEDFDEEGPSETDEDSSELDEDEEIEDNDEDDWSLNL
mgnify:CR=1 FL=1